MHHLEWLATALAVIASTFRAFNWGYQRESYIVTVVVQILFTYWAWTKENMQLVVLNLFYMITALVGAYSFSRPIVGK